MSKFDELAKKLAWCHESALKMAKEIDPSLITAQEQQKLATLLATSARLCRFATIKARENRHATVTRDEISRLRAIGGMK